jgi:hypothetical protein
LRNRFDKFAASESSELVAARGLGLMPMRGKEQSVALSHQPD